MKSVSRTRRVWVVGTKKMSLKRVGDMGLIGERMGRAVGNS